MLIDSPGLSVQLMWHRNALYCTVSDFCVRLLYTTPVYDSCKRFHYTIPVYDSCVRFLYTMMRTRLSWRNAELIMMMRTMIMVMLMMMRMMTMTTIMRKMQRDILFFRDTLSISPKSAMPEAAQHCLFIYRFINAASSLAA